MKSLILKIFLAYWFAAGVVIFVSDFEPHWPTHNPELSDALNASLRMQGRTIIEAYESGRCKSMQSQFKDSASQLYLATADGRIVCGDLRQAGIEKLIHASLSSHKRIGGNFGSSQFIALPAVSQNKHSYALLLEIRYPGPYQVYKHLPGYTSIAISGVVTFLLAVLIAFPLRRLRRVARRIAEGSLESRLKIGALSRLAARLHLHDDIDGLVDDFNLMAVRLQSLVESQRLLLRDVSHELRSPLARLAVALEMCWEICPEEVHIHLDRIELESARLNSLIGQILAFSYLESVSELRHTSLVSLNELVQELFSDVQYEAENRKCRIVTTPCPEAVVNGDPDMLRHALENIVRNAIRHSPENGMVEIDIDIQEHAGGCAAIIRVADTGPGVTEDKLNLILNPFYRIEESRRGTTSGFGVGLAIADRAARLHSGQIVASNRKGGGLVVAMQLPLLE